MEAEELRRVAEALLFVSDVPLSAKRVASLVKDADEEEARRALAQVAEELNALHRSFQAVVVAEGWQLVTRPEYHKWVRELYKVVTTARLTRPALEALAIIAYKQPVTRAEIEAIRGVDVSTLLQSLLQKKMIRILGRAEAAGRPLLYGTTREFLLHFGLKSLGDLPRVSEIQELAGDQLTPDVMKEMEGELRRREAKMGLEPMELAGGEVAPVPQEEGSAPAPDAPPSGTES